MGVSLAIPGPLRIAELVDRPNRFVVRARLSPEDTLVSAHLADPGRLTDILHPGARIFLRRADAPDRRTEWSVALAELAGGGLVSLDTTLPNRLVELALRAEALQEFEGWYFDRREVAIGRSRFDFSLSNMMGETLVLEVKGATWVDGRIAWFPDAPTDRGARHVQELAELAGRTGYRAALLFIVQRGDADELRLARNMDPAFADAVAEAYARGVHIAARRCQVTLEELVLGVSVPVVLDATL